VGYEDNYPEKGDYDFNDLVVGYQVKLGLDLNGRVKTIEGEGYLVARGGSFNHDWLLHIDLPSGASLSGELSVFEAGSQTPMTGYPQSISDSGKLLLDIFSSTQDLFTDPNESFVNTVWYADHIPGPKFTFSVTLDDGIPAHRLSDAPFDPILYVRSTGYEIHLPEFSPILVRSFNIENGVTSFTDPNGYPFSMIFPEDWLFPNEYVDLGEAYPSFVDYVQSNNTTSTNWYEQGVSTGVTKHGREKWKW
jgi:LruC domain-containing protein